MKPRMSRDRPSAYTTNNVPVPISASEGLPHRLRQPPVGTRDNSLATPQSGDKTQTTCLSLYFQAGTLMDGILLLQGG
ncbi:MAG: hypothetical protein GX456_04280 [Verrucomicrobia bacterium]|nr:hypothetical protein [Verrucomicrobiota bacterium]